MSVYFMINYDVADPVRYAEYNPGSNHITATTVAKHGGEIVVATQDGLCVSGADTLMKVVIQFPNREAALAWHDDREYAAAKEIRLSSTTNLSAYIVDKLTNIDL